MCRARSTRPRGAASTPAVPTPSTAAGRRSRRCARPRPTISPPATCTTCPRHRTRWRAQLRDSRAPLFRGERELTPLVRRLDELAVAFGVALDHRVELVGRGGHEL